LCTLAWWEWPIETITEAVDMLCQSPTLESLDDLETLGGTLSRRLIELGE